MKIRILQLDGKVVALTLEREAEPEDMERVQPFADWLTMHLYYFYPSAVRPTAFTCEGRGDCLGFVTNDDGEAVAIVYGDPRA